MQKARKALPIIASIFCAAALVLFCLLDAYKLSGMEIESAKGWNVITTLYIIEGTTIDKFYKLAPMIMVSLALWFVALIFVTQAYQKVERKYAPIVATVLLIVSAVFFFLTPKFVEFGELGQMATYGAEIEAGIGATVAGICTICAAVCCLGAAVIDFVKKD